MFIVYCNLCNFYFLKTMCIFIFIYLFLAALGLRCCAQVFSSCGEHRLLSDGACGLLTAVLASLVEPGL